MSVILTAGGQVDVSDIVAFDPQVQAELDPLNNATNLIKTLETELDRARSDFSCLLSETSSKVNSLCKKLGSCAEKSKLCRNSRIHAKKWLTETKNTSHLEDQRVLSAHNESEKAVHQLHQELKKSIVKSCLSTRRSLLQLNNLANQHQLQLLPYFEMKAQFNQMFEEQIKKVPPLEYNDSKIKMTDVDTQFHLEKSSEELLQHWKFQDMLDNRENNTIRSKASISMTSSYQDSLSSENVYLEHLFFEDLFMDLPSSLKLTPGLVNCTVSHSSNSCFKSSHHHSFEIGSSIENVSSELCHESPSHNSLLYEGKSNGIVKKC
ncbi:SH3 domain-binding protein 5-like [Parasteatoda tepidariorum]|uniref:SH3 domain-binding protein 5-like n=1 Tax=Parasteatoda tepidariorum TaxID=114398 RepID=UPI00077FB5F9|nr:SH3 domain-binding protein 5-like [Parasteatoda tepidariorum]XP_042909259.1 SH3 domain-binding protein 5-like [Parasteatoda tepidariorum]